MGRIQHLAIASQEPEKLADFYKAAFGWQEVRRLDNPRCHGVVLSDGAINISVLKFKQDQIGRGLEFTGLHHMGVFIDDMAAAEQKCLELGALPYDELPEDRHEVNYRPRRSDKFKGPEGNLFDINDKPWIGAAPVKLAAE
jgi:catechol 2,3-dioxygenase-like lactoylglutathione lyase family enzyme